MSGQTATRSDDEFASANNKLDSILDALNSLSGTSDSLSSATLAPVPDLDDSTNELVAPGQTDAIEPNAFVPPAIPTIAEPSQSTFDDAVDTPSHPPTLHVVAEPPVEPASMEESAVQESARSEALLEEFNVAEPDVPEPLVVEPPAIPEFHSQLDAPVPTVDTAAVEAEIATPAVSLPEVSLPEVSLPEVELPETDLGVVDELRSIDQVEAPVADVMPEVPIFDHVDAPEVPEAPEVPVFDHVDAPEMPEAPAADVMPEVPIFDHVDVPEIEDQLDNPLDVATADFEEPTSIGDPVATAEATIQDLNPQSEVTRPASIFRTPGADAAVPAPTKSTQSDDDDWVSHHHVADELPPVSDEATPSSYFDEVPLASETPPTPEQLTGDALWSVPTFDELPPSNDESGAESPVDGLWAIDETEPVSDANTISTTGLFEDVTDTADAAIDEHDSHTHPDSTEFSASLEDAASVFATDEELPIPDFTGVYDETPTDSDAWNLDDPDSGVPLAEGSLTQSAAIMRRDELDKLRPGLELQTTEVIEPTERKPRWLFLLIILGIGLVALLVLFLDDPDVVAWIQDFYGDLTN